MIKGIICIESELQVTSRGHRLTLNSEPLIRFIHEMYEIPYIYRRVATLSELKYYLKEFRKKEYKNNYDVLYFSFHGNTRAIQLEGEKKLLTLNELVEIEEDVFVDRVVHFSSCRTLLGDEQKLKDFKNSSGAKSVSGYTKSVDSALSAIHDVALMDAFINKKQLPADFRRMSQLYGNLEEQLGFRHF